MILSEKRKIKKVQKIWADSMISDPITKVGGYFFEKNQKNFQQLNRIASP